MCMVDTHTRYTVGMQTKERATVTLTAETLRAAREMIPDLNLSALFDQALAERVRQARDAKMAASYAEHPNDYDDDVDWASLYGVSAEAQARAMAARRPWRGDD
jgi:post-segregation antitoxin (ccd killing protein)